MDKEEIRSLLSIYRAGESEASEGRFAEARAQAERDPALARWWAEEQLVDDLIGEKLESASAPADLRSRLLGQHRPVVQAYHGWGRKLSLLAAAIVVLAVLFGSWRGPFQPAVSLADYRDEMVSFIKVDPSLAFETSDLSSINSYLEKTGAPAPLDLPPGLLKTAPAGCRTLRFRGHDVSLVCFSRGSGKYMHLFVVDRSAFPRLRKGEEREFRQEGDWMTAMWMEGDQSYLLAVEGDQATLEKYLGTR